MDQQHKSHHEIIAQLNAFNLLVHPTLTDMLNEDFSHQTERRGCGYTQATRYIADFINQVEHKNLSKIFHADIRKNISTCLDTQDEIYGLKEKLTICQNNLSFEESHIFFSLLIDLFFPIFPTEGQINGLSEKPKVGSCTMAEKFFLEIAHQSIPRAGLINIIVDQDNTPVFLEKVNIGDSHSCISLRPLYLNGIGLPTGSLFSTTALEHSTQLGHYPACRSMKGNVIPLGDYQGFWFLRFSTLAISVQNRKRAFGQHLKWQIENGIFSCDKLDIQTLIDLCHAQV
jgi:hypothetical protein